MDKKRKSLWVRIAVGTAAVILYVAAYFDSVGADLGLHLERGDGGAEVRVSREPRYKLAQPFSKWFFYPMYEIDRSVLRRAFWASSDPKAATPRAG